MVQASTKITDFVAGSTLVKKSLIDTAVPIVGRLSTRIVHHETLHKCSLVPIDH